MVFLVKTFFSVFFFIPKSAPLFISSENSSTWVPCSLDNLYAITNNRGNMNKVVEFQIENTVVMREEPQKYRLSARVVLAVNST